MFTSKIRVAIIGFTVIAWTIAGAYIMYLRSDVSDLKAQVQQKEYEINITSIQVSSLTQGNTVLKSRIEENNLRIDELALQTKQQQEKSALELQKAKEQSKTYAEQIKSIKAKQPVGNTECEKVESLLSDL